VSKRWRPELRRAGVLDRHGLEVVLPGWQGPSDHIHSAIDADLVRTRADCLLHSAVACSSLDAAAT
jgi:hypothetical protein